MNKVININFQGSIIPIEESASELLRSYVESLRSYFAEETGRDEIINDIESRIAELFLDRLKKGAVCITDNDVKEITAGIGHPEDLEAAEADVKSAEEKHYQRQQQTGNSSGHSSNKEEPKHLYRSANNQIIGGVAAGLANYLGIDPSIIRVIFAFCLLAGFGILLYLILWAVLPEKQLSDDANIKRRLFRNPDEKKLGGVASGLAAYFNIDVWIPRVIFLLPIILGAAGSIFRHSWFGDFDVFHDFVFSGFGGTLFIIYIVLWAVLPEATTAAEKLQMRGEKVDLESIKKTVNDELQNLKGKAESWSKDAGARAKEKAGMMKKDISESVSNFSSQTSGAVRNSRSGLGHAIGTLVKIFVFTIMGFIILGLLIGLAGLITAAITGNDIKNYVLDGTWENVLAWGTILLFFGAPVIGLLVWMIRALRGVRSRNPYLGYTFGFLWVIGWVCVFALVSLLGRDFSSKATKEETMQIATPSGNKLYVKVDGYEDEDLLSDWKHNGGWPRFNKKEDSIFSNNLRVKVLPSKDSAYHVKTIRIANGKDFANAEQNAGAIHYNISQQDSILHLDKYLVMARKDKFRNQQVLIVLEVPIGKKIELDEQIDHFDWHNVEINSRKGLYVSVHDRWDDDDDQWETGTEYKMSPNGLQLSDSAVIKRKEKDSSDYGVDIDKKGIHVHAREENDDTDSTGNNNN
ncbi:PspC domain-containing protein [Chitinophagaceae bacterium MMS25-I14]